MTPEEFNAMTRAAAARVENLTAEQAQEALNLLEAARKDLLAKLADSPTEFGEWYYNELLKDTQQIFKALETEYNAALEGALDRMAEAVEQAVDAPLDAAGLTVSLPSLSRQSVEFLSGFQPGQLIKGLTDEARTLAAQELRQALMGVKKPFEVQQALSKLLGIGGRISFRTETIWRTESLRVFNVLAQTRYDAIMARNPGRFRKVWLHSGNPKPRPAHVRLNGKAADKDGNFNVNGYTVSGPHDPALPAAEVINCGCTTILELRKTL